LDGIRITKFSSPLLPLWIFSKTRLHLLRPSGTALPFPHPEVSGRWPTVNSRAIDRLFLPSILGFLGSWVDRGRATGELFPIFLLALLPLPSVFTFHRKETASLAPWLTDRMVFPLLSPCRHPLPCFFCHDRKPDHLVPVFLFETALVGSSFASLLLSNLPFLRS